ncbi:hypothetical protein [Falsihalocynthiibacter arcticus]|uniref:Uncharacterized protein n=1 Tax=Falsihalocynthiibacter arcticus TaxID=1579316 RepID=A0A126V0Q9_9RHOB|nr:hypothetical protein [Falsihalocynthiibacter arcticus]AML51912.1 hypothetical protein RC74_12120 [Falsihalocynthiibacter arcticus]
MEATNRNRKLLLSDAWKHYWSEFLPGGVDWCADLENAMRRCLYFPGDVGGFSSDEHLENPSPSWGDNLDVNFQANSVGMKFLDEDFGRIQLFTDQLIPVLSNWANTNPLDRVARLGEWTDQDRTECRDFFIAVVRKCGNGIQSRLLHVLKETEIPKFEIYCRQHDAAFSEVRKLPISGISAFSGINIEQNELTGRLRNPAFSQVHLKKRKLSKAKAGPHGSFHEQDANLIEDMKTLIDDRKAQNVRQSAEVVLIKAPRRKGANDESVLRRLQKGFKDKYPNDTNRRGQKGRNSSG